MTTDSVPVLLHRLDEDLPVPVQAHPGDAGLDLCAREGVVLAPGERALVPTGVALALPAGYAGFVHPRSGLAARHGVTVVNAPGTVDAGYRGEIKVCLLNTDRTQAFTVHRGDRIAQLVVQPVSTVAFTEVARLPGSARGDSGHGDSGGFGAAPDLITTDTKD
ncbi:dUTP diphosphatase [Ornithinimicrobium sediminis]|uniref:dUTP diphosphatase n=1 Tax=Ornithinimicrobium sediminis TaxID=2904603 RepID=UPI001E2B7D72|nr:dUTP diphosphatase [Ornithinimicrobium sediminis]